MCHSSVLRPMVVMRGERLMYSKEKERTPLKVAMKMQ